MISSDTGLNLINFLDKYYFDSRLKDQKGLKFLLGVGAQKAGTTWLHDYLYSHEECDVPPEKELHVLDLYYRPELFERHRDNVKMSFPTKLLADVARFRPLRSNRLRLAYGRWRCMQDITRYTDYVLSYHTGAPIVGEITPSYNTLTREHFRAVREMIVARGMVPRVIFLMRDPVERLHSAVRMRIRDEIKAGLRSEGEQNEASEINRFIGTDQHLARSDYAATVQSLDSVFEESELLYGFYEQLFDKEQISRICDFLNIEFKAPDFGKRLNVSAKTRDLGPEEFAKVHAMFADSYEFCKMRFKDALPAAWNTDYSG